VALAAASAAAATGGGCTDSQLAQSNEWDSVTPLVPARAPPIRRRSSAKDSWKRAAGKARAGSMSGAAAAAAQEGVEKAMAAGASSLGHMFGGSIFHYHHSRSKTAQVEEQDAELVKTSKEFLKEHEAEIDIPEYSSSRSMDRRRRDRSRSPSRGRPKRSERPRSVRSLSPVRRGLQRKKIEEEKLGLSPQSPAEVQEPLEPFPFAF